MKQKVKSEGRNLGRKTLFMVSIHYDPITLMFTKRKTISSLVAQDYKLKLKGSFWLLKIKSC